MKHLYTTRYKDLFNKTVEPLQLSVDSITRVCILSDCHLQTPVDPIQYKYIEQALESSDQCIINGDFWADKHITFDEFIHSGWSELFPLFLKKNTIYLFGNHDMPSFADERIYSFCKKAGFRLKFTAGSLKFHIEHGHLLSSGTLQFILRLFETNPRLLYFLTAPAGFLYQFMFNSTQPVIRNYLLKLNTRFKQIRYSVSTNDEYFVMGHTHVQEFDEEAKYINSGRTHGGEFSYIKIYKNTIELKKELYYGFPY